MYTDYQYLLPGDRSTSSLALETLSVAQDRDDTVLATEGLLDYLRRFGDTLVRLGTNLSLTLFSGKELKRSEFKMFVESYRMQYNHIVGLQDSSFLKTFQAYIPERMSTPYHTTTKTIIEYTQKIIPLPVINELSVILAGCLTLTEFRDLDRANIAKITKSLEKINLADVDKAFAPCFKESPKVHTKPAVDVVGTIAEYKKTADLILTFESHYQQAMEIVKIIQGIQTSIDQIVSMVSAVQKPTRTDDETIQLLSAYIRKVAEVMDVYGVCVHEMQRVEHNFVLLSREMLEQVRRL